MARTVAVQDFYFLPKIREALCITLWIYTIKGWIYGSYRMIIGKGTVDDVY